MAASNKEDTGDGDKHIMVKTFEIINMTNTEGKTYSDGMGDCFFIHMTNDTAECVILVDGHEGNSQFGKKLIEQIKKYEKIDCLVVTHCDYDHIGGILYALKQDDPELLSRFKNTIVIYNNVMKQDGTIHYGHAIKLAHWLEKLNLQSIPSYSANASKPCQSGILHILYPEKARRFRQSLLEAQKESPYMTILHPGPDGIKEVYDNYIQTTAKIQRKTGKDDVESMTGTDFGRNKVGNTAEIINRNSVVFLLEYADKKVMFCGDGYMDLLSPKADQFLKQGEKIDLIKMAHHGALNNNRDLEVFCKNHCCSTFLVTGELHWAKEKLHPSEKLLSRLEEMMKADEMKDAAPLKIYTNVDMTEYPDQKIFCRESQISVL